MAHATDSAHTGDAVEVVRALMEVGDLDLLYADRYLDRAEARLAPLCSRAHLADLTDEATALAQATAAMRAAAKCGDWPLVRLLAGRSAGLRAHLEDGRGLRALAEAVYHGRQLALRTPALALGGVLDARSFEKERHAVEQQLRFLCDHDPDWAAFYHRRLAHFAEADPSAGETNHGPDADALRDAVLAAIERADFESVQRLLDAASASGDARVAERPSRGPAVRDIDRPFEPAVVRAAESLGLEAVTLAAQPDLTRCLGAWCRWEPDGGEPPRRAERSSCGRPCPVLGRQSLWESLNLLVVRPCATSAGTPYLPRFDAERMLVETVREEALDAPSRLLALLGLPGRLGLSRTAIEHALRGGTSRVCAELGLDPFEFTLAAIPFDAYLRLAAPRAWGRQRLWTHFDGYQIAAAHTLRALVGGDARYGGADGLYAVGRNYDGDHLLARFAVLHRQRFL
jgi:hypothetical protein